jgi:DNA-binding response OmpR family regulator
VNILVVEDDELIARLLRLTFERDGHVISHVTDGRDVLGSIEQLETPPDVVLLDHTLPNMSGLDVLKEIRESETWKDVPVIIVSGRVAQEDIDAALDAGANDYITKPFGVREIGDRVRRVVEK